MHPRSRAIGAGRRRHARLGGARAARPAGLPPRLLGRRRSRQDVHARAAAGFRSGSRSTRRTARCSGSRYYEIARRLGETRRRLALELALLEHLALFSTGALVDRLPPRPRRAGGREALQRPGLRAGDVPTRAVRRRPRDARRLATQRRRSFYVSGYPKAAPLGPAVDFTHETCCGARRCARLVCDRIPRGVRWQDRRLALFLGCRNPHKRRGS